MSLFKLSEDFVYSLYFIYLFFKKLCFKQIEDNKSVLDKTIFIKSIKIIKNGSLVEQKDYLKEHIKFLNHTFFETNDSINIQSLWDYIEDNQEETIDSIYIIWDYNDKEYITFYSKEILELESDKEKIVFPVYSSFEYGRIIKKQEEMFSNGILMVADEKGNILTDDIIKYSGPLENFKMYSHTDDFPFNKIILDFNKREFLFDKRDLIKITDKELNDIEINMDTNKWVHNQQDCDKHLDDLFKESANHNIENEKIEELASKSSIMDMVYNNYYFKMIGSLYHRAFQQKIKKE